MIRVTFRSTASSKTLNMETTNTPADVFAAVNVSPEGNGLKYHINGTFLSDEDFDKPFSAFDISDGDTVYIIGVVASKCA